MKKLTIAQVDKAFRDKKWYLISPVYEGSQVPLRVVCPNGHETTITWNNFQRGQGCKFCAGNVQYTIEYVKEFFEKQGCELLEIVYTSNMVPLKYRCKCGEVSQMRFADFQRGRFCQKCKGVKASERMKTDDEEIVEFCESKGCQFIRSFIQNKRTRIEYVCKCGEIAEAYLFNFKKCPNCKKCGAAKISGDKCWMWNPDRAEVARRKLFRKRISNMLSRLMKATGQQKLDRTHLILGYTAQELQDHITSHPDYRPGEDFHIDHKWPVQAFLDAGISDLKLINCLENLRPMAGPENLSKADKYDKEEFERWIAKRNTMPTC